MNIPKYLYLRWRLRKVNKVAIGSIEIGDIVDRHQKHSIAKILATKSNT